MPFVWCLGLVDILWGYLILADLANLRSILGPALGGALAQPCQSFPTLFPRGTLFDQYPFLLPNLVCAVILALGVVIGILFLEETHEGKKQRRDRGLESGRWLLRRFNIKVESARVAECGKNDLNNYETMLEEDAPPGYRTTEGSPRQSCSRSGSPNMTPTGSHSDNARNRLNKTSSMRKAFTRQVVLNIVGFGLLA